QCVPGDGVERMALTVNRMIPGPSIQVCLGDYIVIDVLNMVKEDAMTIHWHGVYQKGSQYYDGVPNLTQCPIVFKNTFRYQFYGNNGGTHFWHAHTGLQKTDGIFGSLVIREPSKDEPNAHLYNFDLANHLIVINDWMVELASSRFPGRRISGVIGQSPDSLLINGKGRYTDSNGTTTDTPLEVITVDAKQRYRFRLVNTFSTTCAGEFSIEGHNLTVIATDGQPIKPVVVESIISFSGERYDFVVNTNQKPGAYWIQLRGMLECATEKMQQLAILQYTNTSSTPTTPKPQYDIALPRSVVLNPVIANCTVQRPDAVCISDLRNAREVHKDILKSKPDMKLFMSIGFVLYAQEDIFKPNTYKTFLVPTSDLSVVDTIGNISFEFPPVPPISQLKDLPKDQFCDAENLPQNCNASFCMCTHLVKIPLNAVVEVLLVDEFRVPNVDHPFHLHGYSFNVISMGQPFGPLINATGLMTVDALKEMDRNNQIKRNFDSPVGKDTVQVPNNGYVIFRFRASNPGYWLFHCHVAYHQLVGMNMIFKVGKDKDLPKVPKNFPTCGDFMPKIRVKNKNSHCRSKKKQTYF
ncbi:Laccase-5, partial [Dufourea novaeangliae]